MFRVYYQKHRDRQPLNYKFEMDPYLCIILRCRNLTLHDDRDRPGPGCLHPLDIAGSNIGGVVVSRWEDGVKFWVNGLGDDPYKYERSAFFYSVKSLPIIGLLFTSPRLKSPQPRRTRTRILTATIVSLLSCICSDNCQPGILQVWAARQFVLKLCNNNNGYEIREIRGLLTCDFYKFYWESY